MTNALKKTLKSEIIPACGLCMVALNILATFFFTYADMLRPYNKYNVLTKMGFWITCYGTLAHSCFHTMGVAYNRGRYWTIYSNLRQMKRDCRKLNVPIASNRRIVLFCTLLAFYVFCVFVDLFLMRVQNFISLWCYYVPGLIVNIHASLLVTWIMDCVHLCGAINESIGTYAAENLPVAKKLKSVIRHNTRCTREMDNLNQLMTLKHRLKELVKTFNNLTATFLISFTILAGFSSIACLYEIVVNVMRWTVNLETSGVNYIAQECQWLSFATLAILLMLTGNNLAVKSNQTGQILHSIRSLNPNLNAEIIMYSYQTLQVVQIYPCGCFAMDNASLFIFLTTVGVYVFICLQFDKGI